MPGVILYGPPAAGKDTVAAELHALNGRFQTFERLKAGSGRTRGYRMTTHTVLSELRESGEIVWENDRYGATYVVDRPSLLRGLGDHVPILHLGQVEAVDAIIKATSEAEWLVVSLWCPRDVAAERLVGRGSGSTDLTARLRAWDETEPLLDADISINTAETSAKDAARHILAAFKQGLYSQQ